MSSKVFEIVARIMGVPVDAVNLESSPETLENWDSLRHMKLILAIEESLGVQFSDEDIVSIKNVQDLLTRVEARH
ncbi:MAG: acyl carrier protein [Pseudomonadota bacterium]